MKKDVYALGINDGHLATATLIKNGEIISSVSEERFTKYKNQAGLPVGAIKYCLANASINANDLSVIVFGGNLLPPTTQKAQSKNALGLIYTIAKPVLSITRSSSIYFPKLRELEDYIYDKSAKAVTPFIQNTRKQTFLKNFEVDKSKIIFLDHHLTHAYTGLYASGFLKYQECLIFTCDGEGDGLSATVNVYKNRRLKVISKTAMTNSLGNLYRATTEYLGMKPLEHEYKVMGLAAYVSDNNKVALDIYENIRHLISVDEDALTIKTQVNSQLFKMNLLRKYFENKRFDYVSYAVQKLTEDVLVKWISSSIKKTGIKNVVLSGGVFMNVKANQRVSEIKNLKRLFVVPSCGDESNAIGAAYYGYKKISKTDPSPITSLYLGPEYSSSEIKAALEVRANNFIVTKPKDIEKAIASLLYKKQIVARFAGRMEWGARALGNRSILANSTDLTVLRTINMMIKSRDFWMPFAPVVLNTHQHKYFVNPKKIPAPFMIVTFDTTPEGSSDLMAATHQYDMTARPQIIEEETNPQYFKIIKEYAKLSDKHGILNTSFNLHGEPIVMSPEDALRTFENSELKYLAIGSYLVQKKQ